MKIWMLLLIPNLAFAAPFCFDNHGNSTEDMNACYDTVNQGIRRENNARIEQLQNNIDVVREAGYWNAQAAGRGNPGPNTTMISNGSNSGSSANSGSGSYSNSDAYNNNSNSNSNSSYNSNDNSNSNSNWNNNQNTNHNNINFRRTRGW